MGRELQRVITKRTYSSLELSDIEVLERHVLDLVPLLANWKNSFARVNRLPQEIITRVAQFLPYHDIYAGLRVCRYWYNAMMSPEVWSDIDLDRNYSAQVFLVRSKQAPVDVRIAGSPDASHLLAVRTCSARIRSLNISSRAILPLFLGRFSNTPAPLMRDLKITRNRNSPAYSQLPSTFFMGNLPLLETLVLSGISSDFAHLTLPNLTTFHLRNVTDPNATLSLSELLGFLERSPLLQRLSLDYNSHCDDAVPSGRVVALYHMKAIQIIGQPLTPVNTSRGLLAHLSLPSDVLLDVSVRIQGSDTDVVARAIPSRHDSIPCTILPKKMWFERVSNRECFIIFWGARGGFRIKADWPAADEDISARAICFFGPLDVSGIERLVVVNCSGTREHFARALRSLKNLRSIVVSCRNDVTNLLYALCQEGTAPLLRELCMDLLGGFSVRVEDLREMAEVRKLRGQELETLGLDVATPHALVGDVFLLKEYVGNLDYTTNF